MKNRSVPTDIVLPHLVYREVAGAITWLSRTFGFVEHYRYGDPVQGAQMHLGDAWIMLGSARPDRASPAHGGLASAGLTVFVEDVDAHFAKAKAAGARIVEELHETVYGERQYGVEDVEGHHWLFSKHVRDVAPEEWGAKTASAVIQHVSDTALLVAAARAAETAMEDGLVRDPYAARLAGDRGLAIARSGSPSKWGSFGIGLRSHFIDEFLMNELRDGAVDCVLCLGAGLDARPWRLPLQKSLRWIEVDFAPILDYKFGVMQGIEPQCQLEHMTVDLNIKSDRERIFHASSAGSSRILLLTEGLLFYLPAETVRNLALEAADCYRWILEVAPSTAVMLAGGGESMRQANEMRDPSRLEGAQILEVVRDCGWLPAASKTFMRDGAAFARERAIKHGWTPDPNTPRPSPDDPSGVWVFERTKHRSS